MDISIPLLRYEQLLTDLLARPCDACGKPIGGGYKHCPKCNIYLCLMCKLEPNED